MSRPIYRQGENVFVTPEGGIARLFVNKTGAASIKGTLVDIDTAVDKAVKIMPADGVDPIGVIYNDGIPDGGMVYVVYSGPAYVLLEDSTASTRGYWVKVSASQNGRADATNAVPPGGTVLALEEHMQEIGHCFESVTAGTNKLALVMLHFN